MYIIVLLTVSASLQKQGDQTNIIIVNGSNYIMHKYTKIGKATFKNTNIDTRMLNYLGIR